MRRKEGDKAKELLAAAIRIFARDGFDKAQVASVASEAGVGTGSVYLYYAGKDDLLDCLFAHFWEQLAAAMLTLDQTDPLFRICEQLGLFFDHLTEDRDLALVYLREHHRFLDATGAKGKPKYRKCLELGQDAFREIVVSNHARIPDDASMTLSQAFLFGGVRAALEYWLAGELETQIVRKHMLTMAMASILAATQGFES